MEEIKDQEIIYEIDEHGKWEVDGLIRILIEPSDKYIENLILEKEAIDQENKLQEELYLEEQLKQQEKEELLNRLKSTVPVLEEDLALLKEENEFLQEQDFNIMIAAAEAYEEMTTQDMNLMIAAAETYESMYMENMNLMLAVAELYELVTVMGGALNE